MKYYLFDYHPDESVKKYPQCLSVFRKPDNYDTNAETSRTRLNAYEFPKINPKLTFFLAKGAGLTSLIGPDNMGADGLLMDRSVYEIFKKYNLYNSRFYEATVHYKDKSYEYYWLNYIHDLKDPHIDFSKTTYVDLGRYDKSGIRNHVGLTEIKYNNQKEVSAHNLENWNISINKLYLTDDFVNKEYDFFRFLACITSPRFFISERLLQELATLRPTGTVVSKQNVLHEYSYP